jgi:hypothetical protein
MSGARCDANGNLYIRKYATDRPSLSPVVKIDSEGKRVAIFDPAAFSQVHPERADAFAPGADGGLYLMAVVGGTKRRVSVLHFSSDGSPSSPIDLEGDLDPYQFAPFLNGNLLVSGFRQNSESADKPQPFTAVFSADGRWLANVSFEASVAPGVVAAHDGNAAITRAAAGNSQLSAKASTASSTAPPSAPALDLSDAEAAADGNVYAMRMARSEAAVVDVISPAGRILRMLRVVALKSGAAKDTASDHGEANAFHVSVNQIAIEFGGDSETQTFVVVDAQTGRRIATYSYSGDSGASFACYSANEGVFTFLSLAEENKIEVVRAEAQ